MDGAIRISEAVDKAVEYKMPALAITDHGNLFGAIQFYKTASDAGIKPIIGCEVYVAQGLCTDKTSNKGGYFHLVLLAKDMDGYKNLVTLVTKAYTEGFYYKPRIDLNLLQQYSGGLIGLSACLKGEVPYYLNREMYDTAREAALKYKNLLGPDNFYIEIQDNGMAEQVEVNRKLIALSRELNIKLVATNDCHYLRKEDSNAHDILLCIQTGKTINDPDRMRFNTKGLYFKSPDEMKQAFIETPEAILNTREIAEKCNLTFKLYNNMLPRYHIEGGMRASDYMERLAREGMEKKLGKTPGTQYTERFSTELEVIKKMGFSSYFLIVWDFINYARTQGIPVGPGRGSAAGSLIAYSLDITDVDPIKYNLLFERFLNPDRISMPDIDVDFCKDRRGEVIAYTAERYGKDHVAQIITFGTMAAKGAVRDVGRALGMPYSEVDRIARLIPNTLNITLKEALEAEPELKNACDKSDEIKRLLDIAMRLEGLCRHASTHAAGVVISPTPLTDYTPLYKHPSEDAVITQFDMQSIERMGLLKFDFLGLKTLTVLQKTVAYLQEKGITLNLRDIPVDDAETYALLGKGFTTGVFQLESSGMKDILIKMQPNRFEDLIAINALYRPGPIGSGMIDDFIKRKKGLTPVSYDLPQLKEVLDETYGVILYQEQVMRIANKLAGFTMGQADTLRKAMGKKIAQEMDKLKGEFIKGSVKNKIHEKTAEKIFDLMALFAKYGFNKSHSAAYAYLTYQTAYLKTHYPVEFMAANLSSEDTSEKVVKFIKECHDLNIEVLPPHINESARKFSVVAASSGKAGSNGKTDSNGKAAAVGTSAYASAENSIGKYASAIRFGLEALKGVGAAAIESILEMRQEKPFTSLDDFVNRVDSRKVNKKVIESLIKAGAFDTITPSRAGAMDCVDALLSGSRNTLPSLFAPASGEDAGTIVKGGYDWDESERLKYEKEALGFYVTSHPVKKYEKMLSAIKAVKTSVLENTVNNSDVKVGGVVASLKKKQIKDNRGTMAVFVLEDDEGSVECIAFPDVFQKSQEILSKEGLIVVRGRLDVSEKGTKIIASEIDGFSKAVSGVFTKIEISLPKPLCTRAVYEQLSERLSAYKGPLSVHLKLNKDDWVATVVTNYSAAYDENLFKELERVTGKGAVTLN